MAVRATRTETREIPRLELRADVVADSFAEETGTFEVVWTTGARVKRGGFFSEPFYEELSLERAAVDMGRLASGTAPLLDTHRARSVRDQIGVVDAADIGRAKVRLSNRQDVADIKRDLKDKIIRNVSVGYDVHRFEELPERQDGLKVFRAVRWEPYELTLAPMGADPDAHVRAEQAQNHRCEFVTFSRGEPDMEPKNPAETTPPAANATETRAAPPPAPNAVAVAEAAVKAERERAAAIRLAGRTAKLGEEFVEKLVADGVTVEAARAAMFDELAKRSDAVETRQHTGIEVGEEDGEKFQRAGVAALIERAGYGQMVRDAVKTGKVSGLQAPDGDGGELRGMSLVRLAEETLRRSSVSVRGLMPEDIAGRAFAYRSTPGMATAGDFPVMLEGAARTILLAAYAIQPDTWRRFCDVQTVADFRDHERVRGGSFGDLDDLDEHEEYRSKAIPDGEKYSIRTDTVGNMIAFTRKVVVNDDLGFVMNFMANLGRAANRTIENRVYALLALNGGLGPTQDDSQPFFHANRKNVGASSALGVAAIDADAAKMGEQTDFSGNETLDLRPAVLLIPRGLRGRALEVNDSQFNFDDPQVFERPNTSRGLFRDIVDTSKLTGTRRYLFAEPSIAPAVIVAFLEGSGQAPRLDTMEGWRVNGTEMRVRLDMHPQMGDFRGALTNAGTP